MSARQCKERKAMSVLMLWPDAFGQCMLFQTWTAIFLGTWVFQEPQFLAFIHVYGLKTTIREASAFPLESMVSSIINRADQKGFLSQQKKMTITTVLKNKRGWRITETKKKIKPTTLFFLTN